MKIFEILEYLSRVNHLVVKGPESKLNGNKKELKSRIRSNLKILLVLHSDSEKLVEGRSKDETISGVPKETDLMIENVNNCCLSITIGLRHQTVLPDTRA